MWLTINIYPYRHFLNNLKLLFLLTTTVDELEEGTMRIQRYGFKFATHDVLQIRVNDTTILSSISGHI